MALSLCPIPPPSPRTSFVPAPGFTHPHTPTYSLTHSPLPCAQGSYVGPLCSHSTLGTLAHDHTDIICPHDRLPGGPGAPPEQHLRSGAPPDPRPCTVTWRQPERFDRTVKAPVNVLARVSVSDPELQEGLGIISLFPEVLDLRIKTMVIH